jgi:hypothetical protein
VGGVTDHVELFAGPLQRVELVEELLFSQFFLGEAALALSWVSMKYFTSFSFTRCV